MVLQYQNAYADFRACHEELSRDMKGNQRSEYYYSVCWYTGVLLLGGYVAYKHDEFFVVFLFGVLAFSYLLHNWSFAKHLKRSAEHYAASIPETICNLTVDETALTERFHGVEVRVEWSQIHDYDVVQDLILIRFLRNRAFIVLLRHVSATERDELIATLEKHNIRKRA